MFSSRIPIEMTVRFRAVLPVRRMTSIGREAERLQLGRERTLGTHKS
jgi:hypothetical protein